MMHDGAQQNQKLFFADSRKSIFHNVSRVVVFDLEHSALFQSVSVTVIENDAVRISLTYPNSSDTNEAPNKIYVHIMMQRDTTEYDRVRASPI